MKRLIVVLIIAATAILMASCGGISTPPSPTQGLYVGTAEIGGVQNTFQAIILPNGLLYASYNSTTQGFGTVASGQITVAGGNYTSNLNILTPGALYQTTGAMVANQQGTVLEGTVNVPTQNTAWSFGGSVPASTSYLYNTPAQLSAVAGAWQAGLWTTGYNRNDNVARSGLQVNGSGAFSNAQQSPQTCNYNGTFTPDATHNFYNVSLTYSGSCPSETMTGVGVVTITNTQTGAKQLQVVLNDGEGFIVNYVPPAT
jgi:hypothetical protein